MNNRQENGCYQESHMFITAGGKWQVKNSHFSKAWVGSLIISGRSNNLLLRENPLLLSFRGWILGCLVHVQGEPSCCYCRDQSLLLSLWASPCASIFFLFGQDAGIEEQDTMTRLIAVFCHTWLLQSDTKVFINPGPDGMTGLSNVQFPMLAGNQ
jgi:hypothetical protein